MYSVSSVLALGEPPDLMVSQLAKAAEANRSEPAMTVVATVANRPRRLLRSRRRGLRDLFKAWKSYPGMGSSGRAVELPAAGEPPISGRGGAVSP